MNDKIKNLIADIRRKQYEWIRKYFLTQEAMQKMTERMQLLASELLQEKARVATLETKINDLYQEIQILKNSNEELITQNKTLNITEENNLLREDIETTQIEQLNIERISELLRETQYYISRIQNEHNEQ